MESHVVPVSLRAQLMRGLLEVNVDDAVLPPSDLFGFAERRNPKRAFLFVSKVLGRHIPVCPSVMSASFEGLANPRVLGVHGQHEDQRLRRKLQDAAGSLDAVHFRQGAIHHNDARLEQLRLLNGLLAIAGLADDVHVGFVFEHAAKAAAHEAVIIDQQD